MGASREQDDNLGGIMESHVDREVSTGDVINPSGTRSKGQFICQGGWRGGGGKLNFPSQSFNNCVLSLELGAPTASTMILSRSEAFAGLGCILNNGDPVNPPP